MAPNSASRDRRPNSVGAFLRSLRSPSKRSEILGSTSQTLHVSAHLTVPGALGTDLPVRGNEIAGLSPNLPSNTLRAPNNHKCQTLAVSSVSPASGSASPVVLLPASQPLLPERTAIHSTGRTGRVEGTLTTPYEPRRRDLWGRAAEASDAANLKKLQSLNPSPTNPIEVESVTNVLESTRARARLQQNRIWKQRWLSLVRSVSRFKSLIDAGLQFDPTGYGALAWSVLSFGLEAAISHDEIDNDLLESCEYLRAIIEKYAIYEAHYLEFESVGRKGLENSIIDVYKIVIMYAAEMSQYIGNRTGKFPKDGPS